MWQHTKDDYSRVSIYVIFSYLLATPINVEIQEVKN